MRGGPRHLGIGDLLVLLGAPFVVFYGLSVRAMASPAMIDPYFYTAYLQHGRQLVERFGPEHYYGDRVGMILPAHLSFVLFGPVGGFYAFRYVLALLATGPAYLLLLRAYGRTAALVGTAVVLASPVVLLAWGSDYPDSAAVAYLLGGTACLFMPATAHAVPDPTAGGGVARRQAGWVAGAGVLLSLAVHCQYVVAAPVAALVLGWALTTGRRAGLRRLALGIGLLVVAFVGVTGVLVLSARLVLGITDIFGPQLRAAQHFRSPAQIHLWHSSTWRWIQLDSYLVVPVAVLGAWVTLRLRAGRRPVEPTRRGPGGPAGESWGGADVGRGEGTATDELPLLTAADLGRADVDDADPGGAGVGRRDRPAVAALEAGLALCVLLQVGVFALLQFVGRVAMLEWYFYSDLLWPATLLLAAVVLAGLLGRTARRRWMWLAAPLAVLVPERLLGQLSPPVTFWIWPAGALIGLAVVGVALLARLVVRRVEGGAGRGTLRAAVVGLGAIAAISGLTYLDTVAKDVGHPLFAGQANLPAAEYGAVLDDTSHTDLDEYRVYSQVAALVPPDGRYLMTWNAAAYVPVINKASAQFLWHINALADHMPTIQPNDQALLVARHPDWLVLLSADGSEFPAAIAALETRDDDPQARPAVTLRSGATVLHVLVVHVDPPPAPPTG